MSRAGKKAPSSSTLLTVTGHQHRLRLIALTTKQRDLIAKGKFYVPDSDPFLWAGDQKAEVFEGFFEEIRVNAGKTLLLVDTPEEESATKTRHGKNYLVWFDSNHKKLSTSLDEPFDPEKLKIEWEIVDLDEDSEPYLFCSVAYQKIEFDEEFRGVDEGFFLIDSQHGIIDIDVEEDEGGFSITE